MSEILNHPVTYNLVRNFVIGLLIIAAASIIINILIAQEAYTVAQLTQQVNELKETVRSGEVQINALANPALLSQKAEALGMVTPELGQAHIITVK